MKKRLIATLFMIGILLLPLKTFAKTFYDDYKTLGLKETLAEESIELENKDYLETGDQVNIYLFRGNSCHFCQGFLTFLSSISTEYASKIKLVSFEVWYDEKNEELLNNISQFMGEPAQGVPYIIIGDKVFGGYTESYAEQIKNAIDILYQSKDRYDVFEEYEKHIKAEKRKEAFNAIKPILYSVILVGIASAIIIVKYNKKFTIMFNRINELENKYEELNKAKSEKPKEVKSEIIEKKVKKNTKKK